MPAHLCRAAGVPRLLVEASCLLQQCHGPGEVSLSLGRLRRLQQLPGVHAISSSSDSGRWSSSTSAPVASAATSPSMTR